MTAAFRGVHSSATITVTSEDALRATTAGDQGAFAPGSQVTMTLFGFYSVASADSGRLFMRITDQAGTVITSTAVRTVPRGGDSFVLPASTAVHGRHLP